MGEGIPYVATYTYVKAVVSANVRAVQRLEQSHCFSCTEVKTMSYLVYRDGDMIAGHQQIPVTLAGTSMCSPLYAVSTWYQWYTTPRYLVDIYLLVPDLVSGCY